MILDSVEPCHFGLCWGRQVGDARRLLSLVCTPGVGVGGLEMGVVNVVAHRYKHFGMPPTLSGGEPDRVGPTQPFTLSRNIVQSQASVAFPPPSAECSNVCVIMTSPDDIKGVVSKDSRCFFSNILCVQANS